MLKSNGNYKNCITFAARKKNGTLTEWLGGGLQNRIRQFESARYLIRRWTFSLSPFFL
jgi:hypothetical protein